MSLSHGAQSIYCVGASHKNAPIALRERLFVSAGNINAQLPQVSSEHHLKEVFVISTCNRFEVYAVADRNLGKRHFLAAFCAFHRHHLGEALDPDELENDIFFYRDEEAIQHAFLVASSLDSLIVGETQITGQFKDALDLSRELKQLGTILDRLGQEALAVAKKVRSSTDISKKPVSISHAAIDLAQKVYDQLQRCHVLIVGAGEMSELAARYALKYSPMKLSIANRSQENAQKLTSQLGAGDAYHLSELPTLLSSADIVISSTAAQHPIITHAMVSDAVRRRSNKPICLIDIALPRDIESEVGTIDDVYLFDIDDLKQIVEENKGQREKAAGGAMTLVNQSVDNFKSWLNTLTIKPTLGAFNRYIQQVISDESRKSFSKDLLQQLSPDQRKLIESMLQAICGKITADVSLQLKGVSEHEKLQLVDSIDKIFCLNPSAKGTEKGIEKTIEPTTVKLKTDVIVTLASGKQTSQG